MKRIAAPENEKVFRRELIRGDVHNSGAAMLGGVADHAGLFNPLLGKMNVRPSIHEAILKQ